MQDERCTKYYNPGVIVGSWQISGIIKLDKMSAAEPVKEVSATYTRSGQHKWIIFVSDKDRQAEKRTEGEKSKMKRKYVIYMYVYTRLKMLVHLTRLNIFVVRLSY